MSKRQRRLQQHRENQKLKKSITYTELECRCGQIFALSYPLTVKLSPEGFISIGSVTYSALPVGANLKSFVSKQFCKSFGNCCKGYIDKDSFEDYTYGGYTSFEAVS